MTLGGAIEDFAFRDKTLGWGQFVYRIKYKNRHYLKKERIRLANRSSYYRLFMKGAIYRDCCYKCHYADNRRVGDITLADYWGIQNYPSEIKKAENASIDVKKGVSAVLINTNKGYDIFNKSSSVMNTFTTEYSNVSLTNKQLNFPSEKYKDRDYLINLFDSKGYRAINGWYNKKLGWKKWAYRIFDLIQFDFKRHK